MPRSSVLFALLCLVVSLNASSAQERSATSAFLKRPIIAPSLPLAEVQKFIEARLPAPPKPAPRSEWNATSAALRKKILDEVVFAGSAQQWRNAPSKIEWLDVLPGGAGYRLKKVRYEALPGMWIPALLYEPTLPATRAPVSLCVMGHDPKGKDVEYQQIRCINLVKRGFIVLNVEWFGFGQLKAAGFQHGRMNQLDLCGASGLAPFYLAMQRGLDVLLSHPNADSTRVAVSGLSGGGWQTIWISALDERVTLANPVAGYSDFATRLRHPSDLGDSEQTPCHFATIADYLHLTALRAPRPTLLTYNAKDDCCFASAHALPPLVETAKPFYRLFGKEENLKAHVNFAPGTHNYEKDNREAFYRFVGEHFLSNQDDAKAKEIPAENEVRKASELVVAMPERNLDFTSLAQSLARDLPRTDPLPKDRTAFAAWAPKQREQLRKIVRFHDWKVQGESVFQGHVGDRINAVGWRLELDGAWTVPVVIFSPPDAVDTLLLLDATGRDDVLNDVLALTKERRRVVVADPFLWGESNLGVRSYLYALLVGSVGERPIGIQASQIAAIMRWVNVLHKQPVKLVAKDAVTSLACLVAAGVDPRNVESLELHHSLASLREVLEKQINFAAQPEWFCFGLLEKFDIVHLAGLASERPIRFVDASPRLRRELEPLGGLLPKKGE